MASSTILPSPPTEHNITLQPHEEALLHDIKILNLVLTRNYKQHYRAQYFQRLSMTFQALKKYQFYDQDHTNNNMNNNVLGTLLKRVEFDWMTVSSLWERQKSMNMSIRKGRVILQNDQQWVVPSSSSNETADCNFTNNENLFLLNIQSLHKYVTLYIPELLSRILFAAGSLYTELSRGYFVPLCTVALGCISRIRVLLLRFGRDSVLVLQKSMGWLKTFLSDINDCDGDIISIGKNILWKKSQILNTLQECVLEDTIMDKFMEINIKDYKAMKQKRLRDDMYKRSESWGLSSSVSSSRRKSGTVQENSEKSMLPSSDEPLIDSMSDSNIHTNDSFNHDMNEDDCDLQTSSSPFDDEIGECVNVTDSSFPIIHSNYNGSNETDVMMMNASKFNNIDRNSELVHSMKSKMKKKRKEKYTSKEDELILQNKKQKLSKSNHKHSVSTTSNEFENVNEKGRNNQSDKLKDGSFSKRDKCNQSADKKKKKKKAKEKKRDIFDDIFDNL